MATDTEIAARLVRPFEAREVKFKPQSVKGNRALALAYIDCRVIQDRLDEVLGIGNWQDSYEILPDGGVVCRLALKLGGEWVTKTDVGSPSEQPDGGDRLKAAFSDALKRAAVKFGIGRYLYRLPPVWTDYDPVKKQFAAVPQLPGWAIPKAAPAGAKKAAGPTLPANGAELLRRLTAKDQLLADQGLCRVGELLAFVGDKARAAGYTQEMAAWPQKVCGEAVKWVKEFEAALTPGGVGDAEY